MAKKMIWLLIAIYGVHEFCTAIDKHRRSAKIKKEEEIEQQERTRRIEASKNPYIPAKLDIANEISEYLEIREQYERPRISI